MSIFSREPSDKYLWDKAPNESEEDFEQRKEKQIKFLSEKVVSNTDRDDGRPVRDSLLYYSEALRRKDIIKQEFEEFDERRKNANPVNHDNIKAAAKLGLFDDYIPPNIKQRGDLEKTLRNYGYSKLKDGTFINRISGQRLDENGEIPDE